MERTFGTSVDEYIEWFWMFSIPYKLKAALIVGIATYIVMELVHPILLVRMNKKYLKLKNRFEISKHYLTFILMTLI